MISNNIKGIYPHEISTINSETLYMQSCTIMAITEDTCLHGGGCADICPHSGHWPHGLWGQVLLYVRIVETGH